MEESILLSIRKMIGGIDGEDSPFDTDLIIHINSVLQTLNQLGCGKEDFEIKDASSTWVEFLGKKFKNLNWVKSYVYFKVRMMFDPPASSTLYQALKEQADELEWRINCKVDRGYLDPVEEINRYGTGIAITKGDTFIAKVSADWFGDEYYPESTDVITFTVRQDYESEEALITKVIPNETMLLWLEPEDTKNLDVGYYVFDVQIQFGDGSVNTIIPRQTLYIAWEVTK